jgi:hypothetical protein
VTTRAFSIFGSGGKSGLVDAPGVAAKPTRATINIKTAAVNLAGERIMSVTMNKRK